MRRSSTPSIGCGRYISRHFPDAWETDTRMCGIIGVTGVPDAARVAYLGLYSLQHRGQESAGMVVVNGAGVARSHRGMGLVSDVFSERVLSELSGDVAIGHARYSTAGTSVLANAQPMLAGYRPLVLGRLGRGWVVASETCALDITGATLVRELEPGDFVRIHGADVDALPRLRPPRPHRRCVFELVYFSRPDSTVFHRSVDGVRRALGRELAREHPAPGADCVFSVPDSSTATALGFSAARGVKLEHALIRNHYVGRTFIHPAQADRMAKVKIKFNPVRGVLEGKKVVVVDDSIVRGTTSRALVQLIRQAGATEVHFRVASPPITGPG